MKSIRIVLSIYSKLSIANFKLAMQAIISALTGNLNFMSPVPSILTLQEALNAYESLAAAVAAGNLGLKEQRDVARTRMFLLIQTLSGYCLQTATQNSNNLEEAVAKIRSANLVVSEQGENIGPLPAPVNLRGKSLSQACEIEFDRVRGASMYLLLKTNGLPSDTSVWTETLTTRVKHTFENIPAGQVITCKVYGIGPVGKGQPSDFCTVMAGM